MVPQWSHSGYNQGIPIVTLYSYLSMVTIMCLPLSLNLQAFRVLILQTLRFQPVIPNSAQHLHPFGQGYAVVNPLAAGYCNLTASIHCLTVYLSDIHFSDDPGPPLPSPF